MALTSIPERFTEVDGLQTRYWDHGNGGPPLLLLHGIGGSLEAWHRNLEPLAAQRRTIAIDLPGSGCTARPLPYPRQVLGFMADFIHHFAAQVGAGESLFVVGSSFGGAVAIELAARYPAQVHGLVLVASSGFSTRVAWPLRAASTPFVGEYLTRPTRATTERSLRGLVADPRVVTEDEVDAAYTLAMLPGAQKAFLDLLRIYCNIFGISRREITRILGALAKLTMPTLLIWGDQDHILPVSSAAPALQRLPNARLTIMAGCGHVPYVEAPIKFNALLTEYLDLVESGAWEGNRSAQ